MCACVWGQKVVYFATQGSFFSLFFFLTLNFHSPQRWKREKERVRVREGGVTTDVLPPSESCLFDGDSGAYHVA